MKGIIFDMDGTLLDSMGMWREVTPRFIKQLGISNSDRLINEIEDMGVEEATRYISEHCPSIGLTAEALTKSWVETVRAYYANEISLKPYALEYIKSLHKNGVHCAVATLTFHELSDAALQHHGISEHLDCIVTAEDVGGVSKKHPDIYLKAAALMGLKPADCVVVEDTAYAMKTAADAGFEVWAVNDPWQNDSELIAKTASRLIDDFRGLPIE